MEENMKKQTLFTVWVIGLILLAHLPLDAVNAVRKKYLVIDHKSGKIQVSYKVGDGTPYELKGSQDFDICKNDEIEIQVSNANPLIYKYEIKSIEKTKAPNLSIIEEFLAAVKPVADKAEGEKDEEAEGDLALLGTETSAEQKEEKERKQKEMDDREIKRAEFYKKLGLEKAVFDGLPEDIETLKNIAEELPVLIKKTAMLNDENNKADFDRVLQMWTPEIKSNIEKAIKNLNEAQFQFIINLDPEKEDNEKKKLYQEYAFEFMMLSFLKDQEKIILGFLKEVEFFKKSYDQMLKHEALKFESEDIVYSSKEKITVTFEISYADKKLGADVAEYLKGQNLSPLKTGTFKFSFTPYYPLSLRFGICQMVSTIKEKGEGEEEETNIKIKAPVLNITSRNWEDWALTPCLQFGVTFVDDLNHVFLGPGIQILDYLSFGGGAHFRWGKDANLKVGGYVTLSFTPIKAK